MYKPKLDRWDIRNNLPHGAITRIAEEKGVGKYLVVNVLKGERADHHGIIRAAELQAAIHIWKTRFCKRAESQL